MRKWLLLLRKEKKLTQAEVAAGAFIDRAYYSQIENGLRQPSFDVAKRISNTLGFNSSSFYLEQLSEPFSNVLSNSPVVVAHCDTELKYTWMFNTHGTIDIVDIIGKQDSQIFISGYKELMNFKKEVIISNQSARKTITLELICGIRTYDIFAQPLLNSEKQIIGVATASWEIQEVKEELSSVPLKS